MSIDTQAVEQKIRAAIAAVLAGDYKLVRYTFNYDHDSNGCIVVGHRLRQCCPMTAVSLGACGYATVAMIAYQRLNVPYQWVEGFIAGWDHPGKDASDFAGYGAAHLAGFEVGQKLSKEYLPLEPAT